METTRTPVFHRYTVIEKIGSGGMGTVYRAHDKHLDREVALKVLPPALQEDEAALERFKREARALAHLNHPRVAAVYDAQAEGGFPHLVMELVDGENLESYLKKRRVLGTAETVRIGIDVAEALAHIHEHRIVHRDVKTSNIIMEPTRGAVVADFGIALEASLPRLSQGALGTPEYMSPEQAEGRELDGRSDLYSLGVVLFECLTGRPPFRRDGDSLASLMELVGRVTTEPVLPLARLCPDVPGALCDAVMRCLEKDPDERYASASDFGDALRGGLEGSARVEPGQRPSSRNTGRRPSSRHIRPGDPPPDFPKGEGRHVLVLTHAESVQAVACGPGGRVATGANDGIVRVWNAADGRLMHVLDRHKGSVSAVAFSRDGRFVASGDRLGRICIWDGGTGRFLREVDALSALVLALSFSPDGRWLASGGADRAVRLWSVRTGKLADTVGRHQGYVLSIAFSSDGRRLATSGSDGQVLVWDVGCSALSTSIQAHRGWAMSVDFSRDGGRLLSGGADHRLCIWNAASGTLLDALEGHRDAVMAAAFSPSGRFAASAGRDGSVRLWNARSGEPTGRLDPIGGTVNGLSFSPDGRCLCAAADDGTVGVWRLDGRGFGPMRRLKRAAVWAAMAVLAMVTLWGPLDVRQLDVRSTWTQMAQAASDVSGWMGSVLSEASDTADGEADEHGEELSEPLVAGPPKVLSSKPMPTPDAPADPPDFHPLYGGGALVGGVRGWTIEVGRLRSSRGARWLVEQYRGMGFRAGVLAMMLGEDVEYLVGVGHFLDRREAESARRRLRGRELPFDVRAARLEWDRMVAQR